MESIYCPASECDTCAGIGEVLTDTGIRGCMTCHGVGHQRCPANELRLRGRALEALRATAADPPPIIGLALSLSGVALLLVILHMLFGAR